MYTFEQADSFAEWRRLISSTFVPLDAEPVRSGSFSGRLGGRQLNDVGIMRIEANPQTVLRSPALIKAGNGVGHYKLSLQLKGHGLLLQDGREAVLAPGDVAIYDTQRPYTLNFEEDFETLVLMFPQHLLGLSPQDVSELTARSMGRDNLLAQAISPFVVSIADQLPGLRSPIGHRLAMNIVDLLSTLLADEIHAQPLSGSDNHARMLRRIQHHIQAQLADPYLAPDTIAAAHHIATRTLHKIFAESSLTVSGWIRERRLEAARRDLADPLRSHLPVREIGARWGLLDPAHFSRIFRAAFGTSPTQYRRLQEQSGS